MKKVFLILMVAIGATGSGLNAQESTKPVPADPATAQTPPAQVAGTPAAGRGDDEKAIKALLDTFVSAFNGGNAAATAATYTETAIVVDERGERTEGPRRRSRPVCRIVRRQSRQHDRDSGRFVAFPRPGDGA